MSLNVNGPKEPLQEKNAEIERLRALLSYVATCLYRSNFHEDDKAYLTGLAEHISKRIGYGDVPDTGDYPINEA